MKENPHRLLGRLQLDTEFGAYLGDTRIRLLEAIARHGSISQAAKVVPLSYKAAWDAVDAMNNLADAPLVERTTGGRHGGGTCLTDYGRKIVALFRAVEGEYQATLDRLVDRLDDIGDADIRQFRALLKRLSVRTSARNQFVGPISGLREGDVEFEVRLRLDAANELVAVITRESAENLELAIGREVVAFVKSSSVLLLTERAVRTSARNKLWGTVHHIHDGAVNAEVVVGLDGGRSVTAVVTHDSVETLGLAPETPVCAVFKASSVILATYA